MQTLYLVAPLCLFYLFITSYSLLFKYINIRTNTFNNYIRANIEYKQQELFREKFRLQRQTRLLLFVEQASSKMSNSSPAPAMFIDFKSAFDES
jgi:hypothetical protein